MTVMSTRTRTHEETAVIGRMELHDHEEVLFCYDRPTGLRAIIAVHDTTLGPALGGTRMWPYASETEALNDVMRLSRGMTYKSALAGLDLGGGKAVIIGDARTQKTEAMFRRFGRFVDSLNGRYITAEDVGMSTAEMVNIRKETRHVAGLPESMGGSGDPSPVTAFGVFCGMKAAAKTAYGSDDLSGRKVAVQGAGNVGRYLTGYLVKEGAKVFLTDIHDDKLAAIKAEHPAITIVKPDEVYDLDVDIYSPCALGATVNDNTLTRLKCSVIAGAANNQLADESVHGPAVIEKGILYAPDFLINAGGIINCAWERKGYDRGAAMAQTQDIYNTALRIFKASAEGNIPTYLAANQAAEQRVRSMHEAGLSH
ncbi:MAG: Glu/Leu/Phe/Val dehydrogenase [Flavobacteriales bacterium]|nr:Glu/Leu/Phe/Val dehydrogenase [Flavobacteriales bacterium]MBK7752398.1 Glu/Leu/Phe/Val dehydrogenase [Flavobacteriales bacterium]MBK9075572.1 Glu/Leu/Phe/Val dehydrogenase [Flavobacteriales bacterium]MBK9537655.1 Glu/Leu/Phe/Val dehydrogenase [Flavobacteriales bacterium]